MSAHSGDHARSVAVNEIADPDIALQASAAELEVALQERGALEYDGCWRLMSGALLGDTLEVLLLTAAQHGWGSCIPLAEAGQAMSTDGFDPRQD